MARCANLFEIYCKVVCDYFIICNSINVLPERWSDLTAPPALSLRTEGTEALVPTPCTGETRPENSPSRVVIVGDEGKLTICSVRDRMFIISFC